MSSEDIDLSFFKSPLQDDEELVHSDLSRHQYTSVVMSLWAGSLLNLAGSITILYSVWLRKQSTVYHRLLTVMSIFEILNSLNYLIMPFMPPQGTPGLYFAMGNTATCSISGFVGVTMLLPTWIYSGYLSIYFLLVIKYSWSEGQISQRLEVPAFLLALGVSLACSLSGVRTQSYNARPSELLCLTDHYPYNCREDPNVECERGGEDDKVTWFLVLTAVISSVVGLVCTLAIYCTVYNTYLSASSNNNARHHTSTADRRLQAVAKQSALYFLVYLNVFLWPLATELVYGISNASKEDRGAPLSFAYDLLGWFFFSLQGFLNCLVYLRPRYEQWRAASDADQGRLWALAKAIGADAVPRSSTRNVRMNVSGCESTMERAVDLYESRFLRAVAESSSSEKSSSGQSSSYAETELPSHELQDVSSRQDVESDSVLLPVAGQPGLVLKTDKEQQIDHIVQ